MLRLVAPTQPSLTEHLKVCPNPACPFRRRFGRAAEYQPGIHLCSDCGAELVAARDEAGSEAEPEPIVASLDVLATLEKAGGEVGSALGGPIELRKVPGGLTVPIAAMVAGVLLLVRAIGWMHTPEQLALPVGLGAVLVFIGIWRLQARDRHRRSVQPHENGFVYKVDDRLVAVSFDRIAQLRLHARVLRARRVSIGLLIEMSFQTEGVTYVVASFARERGEPFEKWARAVETSSKR